jgi:hypothetical protein
MVAYGLHDEVLLLEHYSFKYNIKIEQSIKFSVVTPHNYTQLHPTSRGIERCWNYL